MKKVVLCALLLGLMVAVASPAMAWDANKQKNLGQDHVKMTWYILDYGTQDNIPYAIARKYYTNTSIKSETVELLMSKYGLAPEVAGSLYFTEYGYEYTPDGKQFAMTYLRHYDMLGNLLYGTTYDNSDENHKKTFSAVPANSTPAKAMNLIKPAAPAKKTTTTKKVSVKKK